MPKDDRNELPDERKTPRRGGGTRAMRAERAPRSDDADVTGDEARANERSVIPGGRSFAGENIASTEDEQTRDHTTRRGAGPQDDVQASDRTPPRLSDDVERRD